MEIKGKVALVTGGAVRIGKAISLMLAEAGAHVVVNYNASAAAAKATVAEIQAHGVEGLAIQCDVADPAAVQRMAQAILDRYGGVDIIVNGASLFGKTSIPTDDLESWRQVTRISIDGPFYIVNALAPAMLARGGGAIVNIVDLSAWTPWHKFTAHAVGKAGLLALTRQLALELAPTVRVNAVAPGAVLPSENYTPAKIEAVAHKKTLLDRWGTPDDVTRAVRYLLEADYVTGDVLTVDGGERQAQHKQTLAPEAAHGLA
jgi:NAD(P)-dependent dehydrogenase (short-subunit alcohol dehydrogenase family)